MTNDNVDTTAPAEAVEPAEDKSSPAAVRKVVAEEIAQKLLAEYSKTGKVSGWITVTEAARIARSCSEA